MTAKTNGRLSEAAAESAIQRLLKIMTRLRNPRSGCPWDIEQTFETILPHTIEEAYEVADAIQRGAMDELRDELGDLLFQVVFYAQMAKERGDFDFSEIAHGICDKMIRRHPHVFGDVEISSVAEQTDAWERHKAVERKARSPGEQSSEMDGVALALPALNRAQKLQKRAAKVGFDWDSIDGPVDKIGEELGELMAELNAGSDQQRLQEEVGDLLFSCVNLARHLDVDAESALRGASLKFEARFRAMERVGEGQAISTCSPEEREEWWEKAKREMDR